MGREHHGGKKLRTSLRRGVCERHCVYYKPLRDEELSCLGFSVLERLLGGGRDVPLERKCGSDHAPEESRALVGTLCLRCSYYEEDCDFAGGKIGAEPCGGFGLLLFLVREGLISFDVITDCLNFHEES